MIERIIKEGSRAFLVRNMNDGDGCLFDIYKGPIYRLYDDQGNLWMTVAVRRQLYHGTVVTDVASGLMVIACTGAKSYNDAVHDISRQYESINKAMTTGFYENAVKLCQAEYAELRERGVLK